MRSIPLILTLSTGCWLSPTEPPPDARQIVIEVPTRPDWAGEPCEPMLAVCRGRSPAPIWYGPFEGVCVPTGYAEGSCWMPCSAYLGSQFTCPAGMEPISYRAAPGEYGFCACVDPGWTP